MIKRLGSHPPSRLLVTMVGFTIGFTILHFLKNPFFPWHLLFAAFRVGYFLLSLYLGQAVNICSMECNYSIGRANNSSDIRTSHKNKRISGASSSSKQKRGERERVDFTSSWPFPPETRAWVFDTTKSRVPRGLFTSVNCTVSRRWPSLFGIGR